MKKTILSALSAALLSALLLTGCGDDPNAIHYAILTGPAGITGTALTELSKGIDQTATERTWRTQNYQSNSDDAGDFKAIFDKAAEDKVQYVVCQGTEMETPVYAAQEAHHGSRYILFDGAPRPQAGAEAEIRKNTMCVAYDASQMGFVAGYAAVKDGMRNVTFMTGSADSASVAALTGFVNGVGYAAAELGVGTDTITLNREYAGSRDLTPMRMADALKLYGAGTQLIVTDVENIATAVEQAASDAGAKVATVGFDAASDSDAVLFSVIPDHAGSVEWLQKQITDNRGWKGGSTVTCGAKQNGIEMASSYKGFSSYTASDTDSILKALADGKAVAYQSDTDSKTESGSAAASASMRGLTAQGAAVTITDTQPAAGNPQSGIGFTDSTPGTAESAAEPVTEADSAAEPSSDSTASSASSRASEG